MRAFQRFTEPIRLLCAATLLILYGCATIPENDRTAPEVQLLVTGPGIGTRTLSNPPRQTWTGPSGGQYLDLQPDTVYQFTLRVSDEGGVSGMTLTMPLQLTPIGITPGAATVEAAGVSYRIGLRGNRDEPRTTLVLSGRVRTPALAARTRQESLSFSFRVEARDFGGRSGSRENRRQLSVAASVNAR